VVTNDFIKRYFLKKLPEKKVIRIGQLASIVALLLGFVFSLAFENVISAWETMIFVVVTMILVPATMRWHWWRFSAKAFVWSMVATAAFIAVQKIFFGSVSGTNSLGINILSSLIITVTIGFLIKPTDKQILVKFYSKVKPFGFWGPIRKEAVQQGLMKANDKEPMWDAINGLIAPVFQFIVALLPFYLFLRKWPQFWLVSLALAIVTVVLYFTWYKNLPSKDEK